MTNKKIIINPKQEQILKEEVVADGNAEHNPYAKRWHFERNSLINFLVNNGTLMTSKENGKQYYTYYDEMLSNYLGINYVICVQYNQEDLTPGSIIYVRAQDKFAPQLFNSEFDTRGRDNKLGTDDDWQ